MHRVPDPTRPAGGPFGPKKKKSPKPFSGPPQGGGFRDDRGPRRDDRGGGGGGGGGGWGRDDRGNSGGGGGWESRPRGNFNRDDGPRGRDDRFERRDDGPRPAGNFGKVGPGFDRPFAAPSKPAAKTPTDWSAAADWYDNLVGDEGSEYHREVVLPGTLKLLGEVGGKRVLDVACGQGVLSRMLHGRGAIVSGVDAAEGLIAAARERNASLDTAVVPAPDFALADATSLAGVSEDTFELAACVLAIQNIHPLQPVFAEVAKRLKVGGAFVVVMMHPAFRSPKATFWGWEPSAEGASGVQFRRVDKYLTPRKEPIVMHPGKKTGEYTWTFHRPIGDYVNAARKAGLLTDAMEEWPSHKVSDSGPRAPAENVSKKEIPMFLALRCVKVAAAT